MKKVLAFLNLAATILFFACLVITFLYPEIVQAAKLTQAEAKTILMNLISLILLLSFFQSQLSLTWRIFCLISSFIVLIESILMLESWQQLLK